MENIFLKVYFYANICLFVLVGLIVATIETGVLEKLSLVAGAVTILGLYFYLHDIKSVPKLFWAAGFFYIFIVGFVLNILALIPQYSDMMAWELYLYAALCIFNLYGYYIFIKMIFLKFTK